MADTTKNISTAHTKTDNLVVIYGPKYDDNAAEAETAPDSKTEAGTEPVRENDPRYDAGGPQQQDFVDRRDGVDGVDGDQPRR